MNNYIIYCAYIAHFLTIFGFVPYIWTIIKKQTQPHFFSWLTWTIATVFIAIAQWQSHGGLGAWVTALSGLITAIIAILAWQFIREINVTYFDFICLFLAILALPLWYFMNNPTIAVIILTCSDLLGFLPTFRKTYHKPHSESIVFLLLFVLRNLFLIAAFAEWNIINLFFPVAINIACCVLIAIIIVRRRVVPTPLPT